MYHIFLIRSQVRLPLYQSNTRGKAKTTFATTSGKWHWNVAPFCICLLPCVFCYLILQVLSVLDFCFVNLDNILVYSTSWKEHLQHLEMVFKHLKEANLKIKLSKCQFFFQEKIFQYLKSSHIQIRYSATTGKSHSNGKVKKPSNIDELHHFLGLTGYTQSSYHYLPTVQNL